MARMRWNETMSKQAIDAGARESLKAMAKAVEPTAEEIILAGMSRAQAEIDRMVDALKASQAGASQPREALRLLLTKGSNCSCRVAGYLLDQERKERERQ
jgi:hypothetical protein